MKVKYAVQVLSNHVAAGMCTQMSLGSLPSEAFGTIEFIDRFDKLFDIFNSSSEVNPKKYGKVFTGSTKQLQFLEEMSQFVQNITVTNSTGEIIKVKCFKCWQVTINSIIQLWEKLKMYNFPYLQTRRINQDCLENLFGSIRQQGGNSVNPTPIQFARAFKKLFSTKLLQQLDSTNCAFDSDEILNLMESTNVHSVVVELNKPSTRVILDIPTHDYRSMPEQNTFKYVCGYLIKKCKILHSCEACTNYTIENDNDLDDTTLYCSFRNDNYESKNVELFGALHIPSNTFCSYIHQLEEIFVKNFENNCYKKDIGRYLFSLTQNITFESPCPDFPVQFLIKLYLRMRIYYTLLQHNKAWKGIGKNKRKLWNILHL